MPQCDPRSGHPLFLGPDTQYLALKGSRTRPRTPSPKPGSEYSFRCVAEETALRNWGQSTVSGASPRKLHSDPGFAGRNLDTHEVGDGIWTPTK